MRNAIYGYMRSVDLVIEAKRRKDRNKNDNKKPRRSGVFRKSLKIKELECWKLACL